MRLRGYDEYEVTLGDAMRGERASLGKTLSDVENDLRIRSKVIRAIEDCDLDGFPNASVVPGYVRSYSRYLGMDPDECYSKFCAESGFRSPAAAFDGAVSSGRRGAAAAAVAPREAASALTESRFALPPAPARLGSSINLGGLTSAMALVALIAGLGYGGYSLLQDLQRVGFAPLPEAPEVVAEAPRIGLPQTESGLLRRPDANDYQGDGILAAVSPADLAPPMPARDGPISAIDPATSGVFVAPRQAEPEPVTAPILTVRESASIAEAVATASGPPAPDGGVILGGGPPQVFVHATETAWIRVRDGESAVIFQGILNAGERFQVPERTIRPTLRAGNAGAVYVFVDAAAYGPIGNPGGVVKNLSLHADDVARQIPQASAEGIGVQPGDPAVQRAEAALSQ